MALVVREVPVDQEVQADPLQNHPKRRTKKWRTNIAFQGFSNTLYVVKDHMQHIWKHHICIFPLLSPLWFQIFQIFLDSLVVLSVPLHLCFPVKNKPDIRKTFEVYSNVLCLQLKVKRSKHFPQVHKHFIEMLISSYSTIMKTYRLPIFSWPAWLSRWAHWTLWASLSRLTSMSGWGGRSRWSRKTWTSRFSTLPFMPLARTLEKWKTSGWLHFIHYIKASHMNILTMQPAHSSCYLHPCSPLLLLFCRSLQGKN